MATDQPASKFSSVNGQQPELMLSAVLHLMSHYHANGACPKLAGVIERHLQALSSLPDLGPVLQATCQQLSQQWAALVALHRPVPPKASVIARLARMLGARRAAMPLPQ
ncbi:MULTISPECIES: hypothetical protein [unclassified Janthinobacterium]|uniref:hypothetical protein n=1 Tax=unclassified Janthinobacterium TaxID=2610881 RepID=UPI00088234AE|nr:MULTISPECIES: hypothetical protein [unclassified Janthinobacterium]SDA43058.1 hypothetical protein SAMN03159349_00704 [Janthinobacterium sp. 551a]SFA90722.1 hypothetical protein SAMN03159300_101705 [Janthinobacterium sp. 344]